MHLNTDRISSKGNTKNCLFGVIAKLRVWGIAGIKDYVTKKLSWWRMALRFRRMAKENTGVVPARGVTLIGDFMHGASNSKTNRDFAHALKDAGIPFQTYSVDRTKTVPESDYADILTPPKKFNLYKYTHIIEMFRSPLPRNLVTRRARIAFWEGEHGILDVWPFLAGKDPVIGMSDFNVEYFSRDLEAPVYKILYPLRKIDVPVSPKNEIRKRLGIKSDDFMVLFTFDFGSFKRKNPLAAMNAFAKAFADVSDVNLVFKTMGSKSHQKEVDAIKHEAAKLGIEDRFTMITEYLSHSDLYGLTAACDAYVSLHKGEGFGLGMAEAMLFGKPVVATGWSANMEFTKEGVALPVPYKLVPVKADEYFSAMKEWAEADVDAAAAALKKLYSDPEFRSELGVRAKSFIEEHFSTENFKKSVEAFLDKGK